MIEKEVRLRGDNFALQDGSATLIITIEPFPCQGFDESRVMASRRLPRVILPILRPEEAINNGELELTTTAEREYVEEEFPSRDNPFSGKITFPEYFP
jgi:hypothetical protein